MKIILLNFVKDHCFWTLWTLNYGGCIHFSCIYSFHMAHNQTKWLKKVLFSNSERTWSNLHLSRRGSIKSVLFACPFVCLIVGLWRIYQVDFLNFLDEDIFAIYAKKWQSQILENYICCLDNQVNKTNLDQKQNIWHFNEANISFCALNDAL